MKTVVKLAALMFCLSLAGSAGATVFNFKSMAEAAGTYGESAWTTLSLAGTGYTVDITATDGADDDSVQYAYLDSGNAGLGVCADLTSGSTPNHATGSGANLCNPSGDDNVTTLETLHFVFDTAVIIDTIWFNNNHDGDQSLYNNSINIGGSAYTFTTDLGAHVDYSTSSPFLVAGGVDFTISFGDEQFYVSKMDVRTAPPSTVPEPGSLALIGMGLMLLGGARRRSRA